MNSVLDLFGKENDLPIVSNVCNVYIVQTICLPIYLLSTCPSIYKSSVLYRRISRQTDRSKDRQMERQIVKTERFINRQTGAQQIDRQTDSLYNVHITYIAHNGQVSFSLPNKSRTEFIPNMSKQSRSTSTSIPCILGTVSNMGMHSNSYDIKQNHNK